MAPEDSTNGGVASSSLLGFIRLALSRDDEGRRRIKGNVGNGLMGAIWLNGENLLNTNVKLRNC